MLELAKELGNVAEAFRDCATRAARDKRPLQGIAAYAALLPSLPGSAARA